MRRVSYLFAVLFILWGCREVPQSTGLEPGEVTTRWKPRYAQGFSAEITESGIVYLHVTDPWPEASKPFTYALVPRELEGRFNLPMDSLDGVVYVPVERVILTSTTHIPNLESLDLLDRLVGFPGLEYISSAKARNRMKDGGIRELGANEQLNTEGVLDLDPDVVVGFGVTGATSSYQALEASGIPVVYNGDWMEADPLGKAEWIAFFGFLTGREELAFETFATVEKAYLEAKNLAAGAATTPTVLSGALYRDIWYLPGGGSWAARFITDANARYLWDHTGERGSLSLSLESALERAGDADFWIAPSQFTSYDEMSNSNDHYTQFRPFRERRIYTYALSRGEGNGLLYFEQGPSRPDLILKDLIHWFHPGLLKDYEPVFFKPLL